MLSRVCLPVVDLPVFARRFETEPRSVIADVRVRRSRNRAAAAEDYVSTTRH
jgi:hypothetical protein